MSIIFIILKIFLCFDRPHLSPRGAAPWNPAPFFERKEQRSGYTENCVFGRDFSGFPCKKRSFLLFQKFLGCRGIFSKIPLAGVAGAAPLRVGTHLPPRGAAPWNPAPFFERKEQRSNIAENCVFGRDFLRFPCKKRSFLLFQKFLGILKGLFSKSPLSGCRAEPCVLRPHLPQGALPLGTPLLSLKERSKEAI